MHYPRREYEMSESDLQTLLAACRPVVVMMVGGTAPSSPQENANRAWAALGEKMGFDSMTVQPVAGKGNRFFTAVPSETPEARVERKAREAAERRATRAEELRVEIAECERELESIMTGERK